MLVSYLCGTRTATRKARARLVPQVICGVMRTRAITLPMKRARTILFVAPIALAAIGYLFWCLLATMQLRVAVDGKAVWINTLILGEYCSKVSQIRLSDNYGHTIWQAESTSSTGSSAVWNFSLKLGTNSQPAELHNFRTVVPAGETTFRLFPGTKYKIMVFGDSWYHSTSRSFTFADTVSQGNPTR